MGARGDRPEQDPGARNASQVTGRAVDHGGTDGGEHHEQTAEREQATG